MNQYVLKRLILFVPTLMLASLVLFTLLRIVPGDAIDALVRDDNPTAGQGISPEVRAQLKAELGLDRPLPIQYLTWTASAFRFDFGTSFWQRRPNLTIIKEGFSRTIELAFLALTVALVWGVTLGVIAALNQDTWIDNAVRVVTVAGIAFPSFFIAVMLFFFLIRFFEWVPPLQYETLLDNPGVHLQQIVAPVLVLGLTAGAGIARLTRSQFLEVIREDYIRTARAKGLRENTIAVRHALRNSLLPVITAAGLLVGGLLGGVVIIESVFGIPGMGTILISSINSRDYNLVLSVSWVLALIFMTSNLLVDLAYGWIDPRIRYR